MEENQSATLTSFASAQPAPMQAANDNSLMSYMEEGGTEAEVAAMDDMQFMDALLDHESSFVAYTCEPGNQSHLSPMAEVSELFSSSMPSQSASLQQQQQAIVSQTGALQPQQLLAPYQNPITLYQPPGVAIPLQQPLKAADGNVISQSPLTARLNYPFAVAPSNPVCAPVTDSVTGKGRRKSGSTVSAPATSNAESRKRARDAFPPVSEDEGEKVKRRMDRNQREQQRSQKITEQIACLKELLAAANVHFKPDKHSTLITVADYIKELQARSQLLDAEHKKLIETISKTNEIVNAPHYQTSNCGETVVSNDLLSDGPAGLLLEDEHAVFVRSLDYRNVFKQCSIPLAVASIDGRFMDCNVEFESLTGYPRDELFLCESDKDAINNAKVDAV
jgi:PAS domain-containing protein